MPVTIEPCLCLDPQNVTRFQDTNKTLNHPNNTTVLTNQNVSKASNKSLLINATTTTPRTENASFPLLLQNTTSGSEIIPQNKTSENTTTSSKLATNSTLDSTNNFNNNTKPVSVDPIANKLINSNATTIQKSVFREERTSKRGYSVNKRPKVFYDNAAAINSHVHNDTLDTQYKYRRKNVILIPENTHHINKNTLDYDSSAIRKDNLETASTKYDAVNSDKQINRKKDFMPLGIEDPVMTNKPVSMSGIPIERKELEIVNSVFEDSLRNQKPDMATLDQFVSMSQDETPPDEMSPAQLQREAIKHEYEDTSSNPAELPAGKVLKKYGLPVVNPKSHFDDGDDDGIMNKNYVTDASDGHTLYKRKEIAKLSSRKKNLTDRNGMSKRHKLRTHSSPKKDLDSLSTDDDHDDDSDVSGKKSTLLSRSNQKMNDKNSYKKSQQASVNNPSMNNPAGTSESSSAHKKKEERMEHEIDKQHLLKVIKLNEKTSYGRSLKSKHNIPEFAKDNVILDYANEYRGIGQIVADFSKGPDQARLLVYSLDRKKDKKPINKRSKIERPMNFSHVKFVEENAEKRMIGKS